MNDNGAKPEITVVLVDDHEILRTGLVQILAQHPHIRVIGEADNGRDAIEVVCRVEPTVVVMDISMGPGIDGIEASRQIRERRPEQCILMLTMHEDDRIIRRALKAGVRGYIMKDTSDVHLVEAIERIAQGDTFFTSKVTTLLLRHYRSGQAEAEDQLDVLTSREREIVQLIAEAYTNRQIAEELKLTVNTVETHRKNILAKLGLHNTQELIRYAFQNKIVAY